MQILAWAPWVAREVHLNAPAQHFWRKLIPVPIAVLTNVLTYLEKHL